MGGLSCVTGKPEENEEPKVVEYTKVTKAVERSESQKPWNRHSTHIYCGDRKSKIDETEDDKPPDKINSAAVPAITVQTSECMEDKRLDGVTKANCEEETKTSNETKDADNQDSDLDSESKDSVPDNLADSILSSLTKYYPPPLIAPFDPQNYEVKRRPRSLDSVSDGHLKRKTRPLSYSPGLLKTKHPRSLHSVNENSVDIKLRPQSMDMTAFFEAKGFDVHTQKLRRVLTEKVREKIQQDLKENKCTLQPGQVKYLDEGPSRCFQPSQMAARKKKNKDLKIKEINYLKKALTKPRMKFSKSIEIFFQHVDQYTVYDPMLDPMAAQPSNPWMSDDEMMWEINRNFVEVPTISRIKKWAVSFEDLLRDETGRIEFEQFLKKEYSFENIAFYIACKEIVVCPNAKVGLLKAKIEKEFLKPGAPCEVNVDCKTLEQVTAQLKAGEDNTKTRYIFQPAMEHVYALMKKDSYSRFLRSEQYKQLLEKAQNHYTKKKFFNFGSNKKKTPSPLVRRRGSASSDGVLDGEMGGPAYHSYSTGNLRELDEKPKRALRTMTSTPGFLEQTASPSLRRKTENMEADARINGSQDPRRRSNLEVPRSYTAGVTSEANRKSDVSQCLAINVPRTNIVAPWDGGSK